MYRSNPNPNSKYMYMLYIVVDFRTLLLCTVFRPKARQQQTEVFSISLAVLVLLDVRFKVTVHNNRIYAFRA